MSADEEEMIENEISPAVREGRRKRLNGEDKLFELKRELLAAGFGTDGIMPSRATLRTRGQSATIKRVENLGGFVEVASALKWRTFTSRPRGYWTLRNLEKEILEFIANSDDPEIYLNPKVLPARKAFAEAGRTDIVNALKRLGGSIKVAEQIGLELNEERAKAGKRPSTNKDDSKSRN
jgi:hypothetical protein